MRKIISKHQCFVSRRLVIYNINTIFPTELQLELPIAIPFKIVNVILFTQIISNIILNGLGRFWTSQSYYDFNEWIISFVLRDKVQ